MRPEVINNKRLGRLPLTHSIQRDGFRTHICQNFFSIQNKHAKHRVLGPSKSFCFLTIATILTLDVNAPSLLPSLWSLLMSTWFVVRLGYYFLSSTTTKQPSLVFKSRL